VTVESPNTGLSPVACTLIAVVVCANVAGTLKPPRLIRPGRLMVVGGFPSMEEGEGEARIGLAPGWREGAGVNCRSWRTWVVVAYLLCATWIAGFVIGWLWHERLFKAQSSAPDLFTSIGFLLALIGVYIGVYQ